MYRKNTKNPETKNPETKNPETKNPETKNPETKNPETKKEKKVYEIIKRLCAVFLFGPKKTFF